MTTVAQQFAQTLKSAGVRFVFGVPSGNMIDYMEALRNENGIDFILVGHETTAAIMADICGRLTGKPGVCFATFGPGATNLSTGVGEAFLDRSPLLAFTDEMPDDLLRRTVQMNIDHQKLFLPITKRTLRLHPETTKETILLALELAKADVPGPVHIGVPAGIGKREIGQSASFSKSSIQQLKTNLEKETRAIFLESKKLVLAIGLTAVRFGLQEIIKKIAEKFQIPVVLTPMAKGLFPENHQLYAGVLFHALSDVVAKTYSEADLVVGIGYDPIEFNYEDWMPEVPLIHFDTKPADVNREKINQVFNEVGDLHGLLNKFLQLTASPKKWNIQELQNRKNDLFQKMNPHENSFGPLAVVHDLREFLPDQGILTVDVGAHLHLIGQKWITPAPQKLLMTNGWSAMGFALPAALSAKLNYPELPVVALMGDGGFLMTCGELATAKRLNLKIVFIVLVDGSLSLIRIKQGKKDYDSTYGTNLNAVPEEPTNHYFGVPVIRVNNRVSYQKALNDSVKINGPLVIEAIIDSSAYDELVLKSNKL